jgi:hypothetical protein
MDLPCTGESKRGDGIRGAVVELGRVCFVCSVGLSVIDAIVTLLDAQYLREVVPDLSGSLNSPQGL